MTNGITPANVLITGKACDHKLTPRSATLHTMKDSLRWHIENSCTANQDVLLCVYEKATGRLKNPFLPCQPHPDSYDIGRVFNVAQHGNAEFDCTARDLGKYKKQVLVGSEVPVGGCPPKIGVVQIKMHILDTDIVP